MTNRKKKRGELKDYYSMLGVPRYASQKDIQVAFRKLAQKCHPDLNSDPDATENFKELVEAYTELKDPERRKNPALQGGTTSKLSGRQPKKPVIRPGMSTAMLFRMK